MTIANRATIADPAGAISPDVSLDVHPIRAIISAIEAAYHAKDAAAIARHYAPDAVIADLAPPLCRRGLDVSATQAWLDGWDGPIEITTHELEIHVDGNFALCHGLLHARVRTRSGEQEAWWSRITVALARTPSGWRIIREHSLVPFHMDGSLRATIDLEP